MSAASAELGSAKAIRLVASREIRVRLTSRAYQLTTLAFVLVVVLGAIALNALGAREGTKHVAVTPQTAAMADALEAAGEAFGVTIKVEPVDSRSAGEDRVRSGDFDALLISTSPAVAVVVKDKVDTPLEGVLNALAQQGALNDAVTTLGGDPAQVAAQVEGAQVDVTSLEPSPPVDGGKVAAGYVAGILIFIALMTCGQMVAQGVVEEKTSRVVELLLSALRPWQLLAGKVLGIGVVGLIQVAAVVGAGALTAIGLGTLDASSVDLGTTALWAIIWFVIGFASYALVLASLGSLVSRQEDVGSVVGPVTAVMIVPYVIGISIAPWDPTNPLVEWLSYVPFCAPMIMPIRIALGTAEGWQVAVSVVLSLAMIPLLVWFAGRVYSNAVLRSGGRVKLRDALRSAG